MRTYLLRDFDGFFSVVVAFGVETVDVDEREEGCGVWCEERGVRGGVEADEGGEEG